MLHSKGGDVQWFLLCFIFTLFHFEYGGFLTLCIHPAIFKYVKCRKYPLSRRAIKLYYKIKFSQTRDRKHQERHWLAGEPSTLTNKIEKRQKAIKQVDFPQLPKTSSDYTKTKNYHRLSQRFRSWRSLPERVMVWLHESQNRKSNFAFGCFRRVKISKLWTRQVPSKMQPGLDSQIIYYDSNQGSTK